jgi:hypothetical protein
MLSDSELVLSFIEQSIQGREVLLANRVLKAQRFGDTNQLLKKSGEVLLSSQNKGSAAQFTVRMDPEYWELMNQHLATRCFLAVSEPDNHGFIRFAYCKVPGGYQMHCTRSVHLWRAWWQCRRRISHSVLPMELLIRARSTWYPIRDIEFGQGFLYIKTLGSEIDVTAEDLICWLRKNPAESPGATPPPQSVQYSGLGDAAQRRIPLNR